MEFDQKLYRRRRLTNTIGLALSMGSMVLGLAVLSWILVELLGKGLSAMDLTMFTNSTPAPGTEGGRRMPTMSSSLQTFFNRLPRKIVFVSAEKKPMRGDVESVIAKRRG